MKIISSILKHKFSILLLFIIQLINVILFLGITLNIFSNIDFTFKELAQSALLIIIFILIPAYFIFLGWRAVKKSNYKLIDAGKLGAGVGILSSLLLGIFLIIMAFVLPFGLTDTVLNLFGINIQLSSGSGQPWVGLMGIIFLMYSIVTAVSNMVIYGLFGFILSCIGGFASSKVQNKKNK